MGKGAFKQYIRKGDIASQPCDSQPAREEDAAPCEKKETLLLEHIPVVYDDVSICRALRIHRRVIANARTKKTRGKDWDCVGRHAGMTKDWIEREALKRGIVPDFTNNPLKPIQPGDRVVSCILVGTWPNKTRVTVKLVATGDIKIATVRDADEFCLYEIFDAQDYGSELTWTAKLNDVRY